MALFDFFKKTPEPAKSISGPYTESSTNTIYNLLFCDNLELYKPNGKPPFNYPFDVLFSPTASLEDLQKITDDKISDPRIKVLAYNKQRAGGNRPKEKELLAVIIEIGLDNGLDVLASFSNGTARYINQTGRILIWETTDAVSNELTEDLFSKSRQIVERVGIWDQPRRPHPSKGNMRMTFLVSDGLYFGEGQLNVMFNDPFSSAALKSATQLMIYLTEKSSGAK